MLAPQVNNHHGETEGNHRPEDFQSHAAVDYGRQFRSERAGKRMRREKSCAQSRISLPRYEDIRTSFLPSVTLSYR